MTFAAVQCDLYEHWIHIKCNNYNYLDYRYLQNCNESWYCIEYCSKIFLLSSLSCDKRWKRLRSAQNSSLLSKPTLNLELLVNNFNNATLENNNDPENEQKYATKINLCLFYINACSFNKNFDDLVHLLSSTKNNFGIIG